ncbi:MAG: PIN domain-containing protein [Gammaproteobacteria bacterium]
MIAIALDALSLIPIPSSAGMERTTLRARIDCVITMYQHSARLVTGKEFVYISPVTIAELKYGAEIAEDPNVRQKRLVALRRLQRKPRLCIDEITGEIFGGLSAQLRAMGRTVRYRVQDLWLASLAVQHGFKLLTHNEGDFKDIPGLDLVIWRQAAGLD